MRLPILADATVLDGGLIAERFAGTMSAPRGSRHHGEHLRFVAFDLPFLAAVGLRPLPWRERRAATESASMPPAPDLAAGWAVYVMDAGDDLRVRSRPSTDAGSLKYEPLLAAGSPLTILEGPVAGSGLWWYRVHLEEGLALDGGRTEGWAAAGARDGTPWINVGGLDRDPGEAPSLEPGESPPDVVCQARGPRGGPPSRRDRRTPRRPEERQRPGLLTWLPAPCAASRNGRSGPVTTTTRSRPPGRSGRL